MLMGVLYDNDISPISPFPPFFFDTNEEDIHFFQDHLHFLTRDASSETIAESEVDNNMEVFNNATNINKDGDSCNGEKNGSNGKTSISGKKNPKKRPFTKDRHSKIVTAQGPRDRRMRLSLDIARRFFMVQDMLGFDKASKTVEWLLVQSKAAIKELSAGVSQSKVSCAGSVKSVSSSSECEVVSGNDEMATDEVNISGGDPASSRICKEKRIRKSRKAAVNPLAKESRIIARARARERTIGKLLSRSQKCPEVRLHSLQKPKSSNFPKIGEDSLPDPIEAVTEVEAPSSHSLDCQDIGDESFTIRNKPTSSSILDHHHHDMEISQGLASNNFPNFSGDWGDLDLSGTAFSYMNLSLVNLGDQMTSSFSQPTTDTTLQPQMADIQFLMTWEPYRR